MKCEEFEAIGLDAERDGTLSELERAAAREHAGSCSRCAALQDSWEAARAELRVLAIDTAMAEAPARVEMRLRQEFRTQHVTLKVRRVAVVTAWALAAAAAAVAAVGWTKWRNNGPQDVAKHQRPARTAVISPANNASAAANPVQNSAGQLADVPETLSAENELSGFTALPGTLQPDTSDASILHVRMQRGALGALGLPVNEDRAGEWIQVDLLVGDDGLPQAVRLPQ
jgi:anti-sigma factor RsiW